MERIIFDNGAGGCSVVIPSEDCVEALLKDPKIRNRAAAISAIAKKDVPAGAKFRIIDEKDLPADRLFRAAWVDTGTSVSADLPRAKEIAHGHRRAKRARDFAPLDEIISKQIPGRDSAEVEGERQQVRDADAAVQDQLNSATTEKGLRGVMSDSGLLG